MPVRRGSTWPAGLLAADPVAIDDHYLTAGAPWYLTLFGRDSPAFWVEDRLGRYPAIALDGDGRRVDSVTSNIGHLLGTGFLDQAETAAVIRRLAAPDMDSGFGLRTMSSRSAGFNPLSHHGGSVWSHDTAISRRGLAAVGTGDAAPLAASLVRGLLAAAPAFDFRLPELYGGESAGGGRRPTRPRAGRRRSRPERRSSCSRRPSG